VGIRLLVEVMGHAPDTLTHREHKVLMILAENARDATRQGWPGIEANPEFVRRTRINSRSQRYEVIQALITKGVLRHVAGARCMRSRRSPRRCRAESGKPGPIQLRDKPWVP
jgi:hypothetical protein